jgi:hypothetical protein
MSNAQLSLTPETSPSGAWRNLLPNGPVDLVASRVFDRELFSVLTWCCVLLVGLAADIICQFMGWLPEHAVMTACIFPVMTIPVMVRILKLGDRGGTPIPYRPAIWGSAFIILAAMMDLGCTLMMSPMLEDEGNIYLRRLLDAGCAIESVYVYIFITQVLFVSMFVIVWVSFLQHYPLLVQSIVVSDPQTTVEFLKSATGGAHLTWRQWIIPLRPSEVPLLYHCFWFAAVGVIFGISIFRYYAALEWLSIVPVSIEGRIMTASLGIAGSLLSYLYILHQESRYQIRQATIRAHSGQ